MNQNINNYHYYMKMKNNNYNKELVNHKIL